MNYGSAGMLPVTAMGIGIAGHNVMLGTIIATGLVLVIAGCAAYRFATRRNRITA